MLTASQIIDRLGGTSAVARELSLTPSVVSSWRNANSIPRWWRAQVIAIKPSEGAAITERDFPTKHAARARAADAQAAA